MKTKTSLIAVLVLFFSLTMSAQKHDVDKSKKAIKEFRKRDPGISKFFSSAYGYAIFPSIGKGGFVVGGAGGKGTVFKGNVPKADVKMTQVTIGLQAGGQKYAEVIFFEDKAAYDRFVNHRYTFAAQISAVILQSGISTNAKYTDGVLVFTLPKGGLMYEASIGGQKFKTTMY